MRSGGRCLWSAHRSHRYSKTETSPPSVWLRAVAESMGQYVFHARTYCPETPRMGSRPLLSITKTQQKQKSRRTRRRKLGGRHMRHSRPWRDWRGNTGRDGERIPLPLEADRGRTHCSRDGRTQTDFSWRLLKGGTRAIYEAGG